MTILLALLSGLMWGAADYFGGSASRRAPALLVVLISQAAGWTFVILTAWASGGFSAPTGYLPWGIAAGLAGAAALLLFYRALAIGAMGVVSPIAALGVVVPVGIGLLTGALPSMLSVAGIAVAVAGVVATAGPGRGGAHGVRHRRSVLMAIGSAAGFGLVLAAISRGSASSTVMTMVVMRSTSVPLLVVVAAISFRSGLRPAVRQILRTPRLVGIILVCGVFDVGANLLFGIASHGGALAIVAVLGSLYPAGTVLLARVLDEERLSGVQNAGVVAALAGVAMIAAGS
ncbi:EamA family transporter [Nakamurella sp. PAMC28650]|uniref:EamA family transporter n=1 Tax=Nakamurella sp. PAMC28650 TaxID=2762325 RepID=UPI00164E9C26|nr:EamA family transporter [Nakamurella sp. PAMC28650]QNK80164.1 hypothetical protein H7F38_18390 [Nakamurella sp. PAMC28650]